MCVCVDREPIVQHDVGGVLCIRYIAGGTHSCV